MFILAFVAIVAMASVFAIMILYQSGALFGKGLRYITVTASGTSYAYPQAATLYVLMNGTGRSAAIATANLSLTLSEFNYTVSKYVGGNLSRIQTQSYLLQRIWNTSNYSATELVSVTVPQIQNVSPLLGTLSLIQNVYINQVTSHLTNDQISQLRQSSLSLAINNATMQAQIVAGNSTVRMMNVTISGSYYYPYPVYSNAESSSKNPQFFNGVQGVTEQIYTVFSYR